MAFPLRFPPRRHGFRRGTEGGLRNAFSRRAPMHAACLRRRPAAPSATRVQICAFKNDWIYIINRGLPLLSLPSRQPVGRSLSPASRRSNSRGIGKSLRASLERDMNRMHARTLSSFPRPPAPRFAPPHRCEGGRLGEGLRFTRVGVNGCSASLAFLHGRASERTGWRGRSAVQSISGALFSRTYCGPLPSRAPSLPRFVRSLLRRGPRCA